MSDEVVRFGTVTTRFGTLIAIDDTKEAALHRVAFYNGQHRPATYRVVELIGPECRVGAEITKGTNEEKELGLVEAD